MIEIGNDTLEETFIAKVTIINPSPTPVAIKEKYRCLFRGDQEVTYGRHQFRFPITNMGYKRLVSSLQGDYAGELKVDFSGSGFDAV
jgi:hypothetical protein